MKVFRALKSCTRKCRTFLCTSCAISKHSMKPHRTSRVKATSRPSSTRQRKGASRLCPLFHRAITIMRAAREHGVRGKSRKGSKHSLMEDSTRRLAAGSDIQRFRNALLEATACIPTSTDYWDGLPESELESTQEIVQKFIDKWGEAYLNASRRGDQQDDGHDSLHERHEA